MLAKNVNDNAYFLNERGACEFFASKLAPTDGGEAPTYLAQNRHPDQPLARRAWLCKAFFEVNAIETILRALSYFYITKLGIYREVVCHLRIGIEMNGVHTARAGGFFTKADQRPSNPPPGCAREDCHVLQ